MDKASIKECMVRYARGIDRLDRDLVLSAYHADALDDHIGFIGAPADFVEWVFPLLAPKKSTTHFLGNHFCELDGDRAHCETYFWSVGRDQDDRFESCGGRYIDLMQRRKDEWRIARRVVVIDWVGDTPGQVPVPIDNYGQTARDRSDISYARPLIVRTS
jgi:ketosteroid isomerase-like protein